MARVQMWAARVVEGKRSRCCGCRAARSQHEPLACSPQARSTPKPAACLQALGFVGRRDQAGPAVSGGHVWAGRADRQGDAWLQQGALLHPPVGLRLMGAAGARFMRRSGGHRLGRRIRGGRAGSCHSFGGGGGAGLQQRRGRGSVARQPSDDARLLGAGGRATPKAYARLGQTLGSPVAARGTVPWRPWGGRTLVLQQSGRACKPPTEGGARQTARAFCFCLLTQSGWLVIAPRLQSHAKCRPDGPACLHHVCYTNLGCSALGAALSPGQSSMPEGLGGAAGS